MSCQEYFGVYELPGIFWSAVVESNAEYVPYVRIRNVHRSPIPVFLKEL